MQLVFLFFAFLVLKLYLVRGKCYQLLFLCLRHKLLGKRGILKVSWCRCCICVFWGHRRRSCLVDCAKWRILPCRSERKTLFDSRFSLGVLCLLGKEASLFLCSRLRNSSSAYMYSCRGLISAFIYCLEEISICVVYEAKV